MHCTVETRFSQPSVEMKMDARCKVTGWALAQQELALQGGLCHEDLLNFPVEYPRWGRRWAFGMPISLMKFSQK